MTSEEWARTSLAVFAPSGETIETVEMPGPTLRDQLDAAEDWLRDHEPDSLDEEFEGPRVRLFSSWTPADGRHAMTLSPTLIQLLASAGGVFWMDVHPEQG